MPTLEKFKKTLSEHCFAPDIFDSVNAGFENVSDISKKREKRDFFAHAVAILESTCSDEAVTSLMDANGCCRAGTAREKASKAFAAAHADKSIEERIPLIKNVRNMGEPALTEDHKLKILAVRYQRDGRFRCACPNINTGKKRETPVPRSYCKCCAGHFRFHYQIMLGCELKLESVYSSPLDTDGDEPCGFIFSITGYKS